MWRFPGFGLRLAGALAAGGHHLSRTRHHVSHLKAHPRPGLPALTAAMNRNQATPHCEHRLFSARDKYEKYQPALERLTTEFFDVYLRDNDEARKWLQSEAPLAILFENDKWEWK